MHSGNNISKIDDYRPIPSEGGECSGGLPPKGGGPYDGDMERRIAKLEDKMDNVQATLSDMKGTLIRMDERISHLPTYKGIWALVAGIITTTSVVIGAVTTILHWFHAS